MSLFCCLTWFQIFQTVPLKFANSKGGKQLRKMRRMFWSSFSRVLDLGAGIDCSKQKYVIAGTSLLSSDDHPGTLFLVHLLVLFGIFFFFLFLFFNPVFSVKVKNPIPPTHWPTHWPTRRSTCRPTVVSFVFQPSLHLLKWFLKFVIIRMLLFAIL